MKHKHNRSIHNIYCFEWSRLTSLSSNFFVNVNFKSAYVLPILLSTKWTRQLWLRENNLVSLAVRDSNIPLIRRRDMTSINIYCSVWTHVSIFDGQSWYCWFCVGGFYLFIWDLGRCFAALRALFGFTSRWQRNCSSFSLPWEQSKALIQVRKAISTAPLLRRPFAAHISVVLRWNRSRLLNLL